MGRWASRDVKVTEEVTVKLNQEDMKEPIIQHLCEGYSRTKCAVLSRSVVSGSLQPHGFCSLPDSSVHGDSPGKNTGVGGHALLQGIVKDNSPARLCREEEESLGYWGAVSKGCREVGKAVRAVGKGWSFTTSMPVSWTCTDPTQ